MTRRLVIVTGASAGIGAEIAIQLARQLNADKNGGAYKVGLIARRQEQLEQVVSSAVKGATEALKESESAAAQNVTFATADVTDEASLKAAIKEIETKLGQPTDVLINNAGGGTPEKPTELTPAICDKMMQLNVYSVMFAVNAVLPAMKQRNSGQILNVSSIGGRVSYLAPFVAYLGAKHFLNAYTESLRAELKQDASTSNIIVSAAAPGPVATDFFANAGVSADGGEGFLKNANFKTSEETAAAIVEQVATGEEEIYTNPADYDVVMSIVGEHGKPKKQP